MHEFLDLHKVCQALKAEDGEPQKNVFDRTTQAVIDKLISVAGSDDDIIKLERLFQQFDSDNSGDLDKQEFGHAMRLLGLKLRQVEIDHIFRLVDSDGDGTLDVNEFLALHKSLIEAKANVRKIRDKITAILGDRESLADIEQIFRQFDVDRNGELSPEEFAIGLKKFGLTLTPEELTVVFPAFDLDNSGTIELEEFISLQKSDIERAHLAEMMEKQASTNEVIMRTMPAEKVDAWQVYDCRKVIS